MSKEAKAKQEEGEKKQKTLSTTANKYKNMNFLKKREMAAMSEAP